MADDAAPTETIQLTREADMAEKTAEQFLSEAARKLAEPEHEQTRHELALFVDYWGLEAYTLPDHVEARVREIIKGFVTAAQIIAAEQS